MGAIVVPLNYYLRQTPVLWTLTITRMRGRYHYLGYSANHVDPSTLIQRLKVKQQCLSPVRKSHARLALDIENLGFNSIRLAMTGRFLDYRTQIWDISVPRIHQLTKTYNILTSLLNTLITDVLVVYLRKTKDWSRLFKPGPGCPVFLGKTLFLQSTRIRWVGNHECFSGPSIGPIWGMRKRDLF